VSEILIFRIFAQIARKFVPTGVVGLRKHQGKPFAVIPDFFGGICRGLKLGTFSTISTESQLERLQTWRWSHVKDHLKKPLYT